MRKPVKETEKQKKERLLEQRLKRLEKRIKELENKFTEVFDSDVTPVPPNNHVNRPYPR